MPVNFTLAMNMATTEETLSQLQQDALSGGLAKASTETLEVYAAILCHPQAYAHFGERQFPQICETVRIHLLRAHINSLQRHITDLNAKNSLTQYLVVALTVASLFGSAVQVWYAKKADRETELVSKLAVTQHPATTISSSPSGKRIVSPK